MGEILGRSAGEMVAELVLCLFLPPRPPRLSTFSGFTKPSCKLFFASAPLGVLEALNLADLAERVGVLSSSSGILLVSILSRSEFSVGGAAASGSIMSSRSRRGSIGCCKFCGEPCLLGSRIKVAGVTRSPASVVCGCTSGRGDRSVD